MLQHLMFSRTKMACQHHHNEAPNIMSHYHHRSQGAWGGKAGGGVWGSSRTQKQCILALTLAWWAFCRAARACLSLVTSSPLSASCFCSPLICSLAADSSLVVRPHCSCSSLALSVATCRSHNHLSSAPLPDFAKHQGHVSVAESDPEPCNAKRKIEGRPYPSKLLVGCQARCHLLESSQLSILLG